MIVLLSPTKQMNFSGPDKFENENTMPYYNAEASILNNLLKLMDKDELMDLMKISSKIADQTFKNIISFSGKESTMRSALFAYSGTVFQSINAQTFKKEDLNFACKHLRILSGIYGVLNPTDRVSPYRLEMKTPLSNPNGDGLYHFWKPRIADNLQKENSQIINLASSEYFKVVDTHKLTNPVISFHFKERKDGKHRTVGMYSKVARGLMARRIVIDRITDPLALQSGETGGYFYDSDLSSDNDWVFVRDEA